MISCHPHTPPTVQPAPAMTRRGERRGGASVPSARCGGATRRRCRWRERAAKRGRESVEKDVERE
eukprot:scaffold249748_cov17-Tisochrysis_lutea.AAC.1